MSLDCSRSAIPVADFHPKDQPGDDLKKEGVIDQGMRQKWASAVRELEEGVQRCISSTAGWRTSLLLEIFTDRAPAQEICTVNRLFPSAAKPQGSSEERVAGSE